MQAAPSQVCGSVSLSCGVHLQATLPPEAAVATSAAAGRAACHRCHTPVLALSAAREAASTSRTSCTALGSCAAQAQRQSLPLRQLQQHDIWEDVSPGVAVGSMPLHPDSPSASRLHVWLKWLQTLLPSCCDSGQRAEWRSSACVSCLPLPPSPCVPHSSKLELLAGLTADAAVKPLWQLAEGSIALFCLCIMPPNWRLPYLPQAASLSSWHC